VAEGKIIPHHEEAIVLRTWPFHEADLVVSLLTRGQGKVKGVARHAMKSRKRFGGMLEPATVVRAHYTERPRQDLMRMDSFEMVWSPLSVEVDWERVAGMQLVVEVLEEALPEMAPEDNVFRLAGTVLRAMGAGQSGVWLPVTYFCVWMGRLMGWWPELGRCVVCGEDLRGREVWWSAVGDGVTCREDRRAGSAALAAASVGESHRMAREPLEKMMAEAWPKERARDLREFAVAVLERNLQRRIRSAAALAI
jgi:DNA repair protein RecO (recombination protein O)